MLDQPVSVAYMLCNCCATDNKPPEPAQAQGVCMDQPFEDAYDIALLTSYAKIAIDHLPDVGNMVRAELPRIAR